MASHLPRSFRRYHRCFKGKTNEEESKLPKELKVLKEIEELCVECKLCLDECEFLEGNCESPRELVEKFKANHFKDEPRLPYSCTLCGLCKRVCPSELDIGNACLRIRQQMVEEGSEPLACHQQVTDNQDWALSDSFTLTLTDSNSKECRRFFFPGCNLSGYSPDLVAKTYDYVQAKLPGTGIMLSCCGAPSHDIGDDSLFSKVLGKVASEMQNFGASELIVCCPDCYHIFKENAPHIKLTSVYEVIDKYELPEKMATSSNTTFALHDSCRTRYEFKLQDSVRSLLSKLGYKIDEMEFSRDKTRCCGMGGMIGYVNLTLMSKMINRRMRETPFDIVTYCASCREAFALVKKPSLHILDLIFNPDWEKTKLEPARKPSTRRENQSLLKAQLERRAKGQV